NGQQSGQWHDPRDPSWENRVGLGGIPVGAPPGGPSKPFPTSGSSSSPVRRPPTGQSSNNVVSPPRRLPPAAQVPPQNPNWRGAGIGRNLSGLFPGGPLGAPLPGKGQDGGLIDRDQGSTGPGAADPSDGSGGPTSGGSSGGGTSAPANGGGTTTTAGGSVASAG